MKDRHVYYKKGYKYQTTRDYHDEIDIKGYEINLKFIRLYKNGKILVRAGYAWDGPSGPTWDDETNMRPSLLHDVLYQLMRLKKISRTHQRYADDLLIIMCKEDGMNPVRNKLYYVSTYTPFMHKAADPENAKKEYRAP